MRCRSNCVVCGFMSGGVLLCWAQRMGEVRNSPRSKGNFNFLGIRPVKIRASRALIRGRVEYFMSASLEFTRPQNPEFLAIQKRQGARHPWTKRWPHGTERRDWPLACPLSKRTPSVKAQHQKLFGLPDFARATLAATLQYLPKTFNRNSVLEGARFN